MSSSKGRVLVDEYPTELSLPAKQLCPGARIEDSTPKTKNFLPPASHLSSVAYCLFQPEAEAPIFVAEPTTSCLFGNFALFYAEITSAGSPDPACLQVGHSFGSAS